MDEFDFVEEPKPRRGSKLAGMLWNLITLFTLITAALLGAYFIMLYLNPSSAYNPFPPPTPITLLPTQTPSPTETATVQPSPTLIQATATSEATATEAATETPTITATASLPTATAFTVKPSPTSTPAGRMPYELQNGSPTPVDSTIFHPELGCAFMGVGGQVIDLNGAPVIGLAVELSGTLNGKEVLLLSLTGAAPQYGPGGYEIQLSDQPTASNGTLFIQLKNQNGVAISERIPFSTYNECGKNLILIFFKQVQ